MHQISIRNRDERNNASHGPSSRAGWPLKKQNAIGISVGLYVIISSVLLISPRLIRYFASESVQRLLEDYLGNYKIFITWYFSISLTILAIIIVFLFVNKKIDILPARYSWPAKEIDQSIANSFRFKILFILLVVTILILAVSLL